MVSRCQWSRGLRRRSAAARLLRSWVRIPSGLWMFVGCWVLSGRGLCDELITRPEESYRLWCVVVCDLENLKNEEAMTSVGSQRPGKKVVVNPLRREVSFRNVVFCQILMKMEKSLSNISLSFLWNHRQEFIWYKLGVLFLVIVLIVANFTTLHQRTLVLNIKMIGK